MNTMNATCENPSFIEYIIILDLESHNAPSPFLSDDGHANYLPVDQVQTAVPDPWFCYLHSIIIRSKHRERSNARCSQQN
jgi:hypothetical protein